LLPLALDVATALDLYDSAGGFAAHAAQLTALLDGGRFASVSAAARTAFLSAVAALFNDPSSPLNGALPGTIAVSGSTVGWTYPLPAGLGTGSLAIAVSWDAGGPTIAVSAPDLVPANSPVTVSLSAGYASGALALSAGIGLALQAPWASAPRPARDARYAAKLPELVREPAPEPAREPDNRLQLIFTCCHPALRREWQVALTLRAVFGFTTAEIARAFVASEAAVAQRIMPRHVDERPTDTESRKRCHGRCVWLCAGRRRPVQDRASRCRAVGGRSWRRSGRRRRH
jgi:hypothetical protein